MSTGHEAADAIGQVMHYYNHLSVAAIRLDAPLSIGDRVHIRGHTTDHIQDVASIEVDHAKVDRAGPGDDVALKVDDHVRDHDLIFLEE